MRCVACITGVHYLSIHKSLPKQFKVSGDGHILSLTVALKSDMVFVTKIFTLKKDTVTRTKMDHERKQCVELVRDFLVYYREREIRWRSWKRGLQNVRS